MINIWKKQFIETFLKLDIDNINEAFTLKINKMPNKLYRYRAFSDNSIDSFINDTIYLSDPRYFNDPYDCLAYLNFNLGLNKYNANVAMSNKVEIINFFRSIAEEFLYKIRDGENEEGAYEAIIEKWVDHSSPNNSAREYVIKALKELFIEDKGAEKITYNHELEDKFNDQIDSIKGIDDIVSLVTQQFEEALLNPNESVVEVQNIMVNKVMNTVLPETIRVSCFSEVNNSILMWSHYADNHKGFCLEYDFKELEEGSKISGFMFPVIYQKEFYSQALNIQELNNINPLILFYFLIVKSKEWRYEKEWRLIDFNNTLASKDTPMVKLKPKSIYIGTNMEKDKRSKLIEIAREKGIRVYQIMMKEDAFQLFAELIKE